jgi:Skp family chaperone for outer membrane proteins
MLRARARLRWLAVALALSGPAMAQDGAGMSSILVIDQNRLFVESAFGKASIARERAFLAALEEENKRIEADLVAEEQALTELRATLPAADFSARADAFDAKVEQIRAEQEGKAAGLTAQREADQRTFVQAAGPIIAELLTERNASVILDKSVVILSLSAIDVTEEAIAKVDGALAEENQGPAAP